MCNLFNITWIDLKGFWSIWMFALLVVSGLFCTSMCRYVADEASPMRDVMVIMLGGNGEGHPYSFLTVIVSLIPLSILLLWRGGYLEAELHQRCYYSILRTGNMSGMDAGKNDKLPGYILIICSDVIVFNMFAGHP